MAAQPEPDVVAAADLGSNSFHLIVARRVDGRVDVLDRLRERVALAEGLDDKLRLTTEAQERALACLERFGQRLRDMPPGSVRAVGTNTLRRSRDARSFLGHARKALGHPIEVISGREEARLIYLGVAHDLADEPRRRLVVDIGGGSTECILGEGIEPLRTDSLYIGCVGSTRRFFGSGKIDRKAFDKAVIAARLELETIERKYRALGWDTAVGSSGTVLAVCEILRASDLSEGPITRRGLKKLAKSMIDIGSISALEFPGMAPDRALVLPGGLAILTAVFEAFEIEEMHASQSALREGLLRDLVGRIAHVDARDRTIRRLSERHQLDAEQAARVGRTALSCLEQVAKDWELDDPSWRTLLSWAARLHEIGLAVAHSGYHKHGAYLVTHSDMPGFSREDQALLAAVIHGHRRRMPAALFEDVPSARSEGALRTCVLLRVAARLNRARTPRPLPPIKLHAKGTRLALEFPEGWLEENPLTHADLEEEAELLADAGIELLFE